MGITPVRAPIRTSEWEVTQRILDTPERASIGANPHFPLEGTRPITLHTLCSECLKDHHFLISTIIPERCTGQVAEKLLSPYVRNYPLMTYRYERVFPWSRRRYAPMLVGLYPRGRKTEEDISMYTQAQ